MKINPYITYKDNCREAFEFYANALGGEVEFVQTFGDAPGADTSPTAIADKVMHARVRIGESFLLGSDSFAPDAYAPPSGITIQTGGEDFDEVKAKFEALAEGGEITMPFEATFWARGFGMLTDKFGVPWMMNVE
ncbi:MAG: VOC family protein [Paracoccaceae bacterium]|nr:VOC family protein [Paracoccaceae bacterium]MDG1739390.1 VOC family protein [Paracoccaceae bacterium]MDG2258690.1 VOC family protein [Paracoccaceae bacterium]